jgi:hypothetical protein
MLVVGACFAALIAITWPLVPDMASAGRLDSGDGRYSIWNVAWVAHALLTHPSTWLDANIFWPHHGTLAYSEMNLVAGILGLPAYLVTHQALVTHNFAVVVALLLCAVLTWRLVRRLTGSSGAGLVSAILFTFCSYVQGHSAHVQLLMTFVIPLMMLAFHRLRDEPNWKTSVALGLSVATAGLACGYYGIYGGIVLGLAALIFARPEPKYWLALLGAVVVAGAVVAPAFVPFARARAASGAEPVRDEVAAQATSADFHDYISSPMRLEILIVPAQWDAPVHEYLSPGPVLLILVLIGSWVVLGGRSSVAATPLTERRLWWGYVGLTVFAVWASFGPAAGLYSGLMRVVPYMDFLRAPRRLGLNVAFSLAILGGFGARALIGKSRWVLAALVLLAVADRYTGWYLRPAEAIPEVYSILKTLPTGVVVDYPFPYVQNDLHQHTKAMYYSTVDWMPRVNGYSDVLPLDFLEAALPLNEFPAMPTFPLLHKYQVRYVIWRLEAFKRDPASMKVLTDRIKVASPYIRPIFKDDDAWLYEIVSWPAEAR